MFGVPIRELLAFPYQRLSLETSLPVAEVFKRMDEAVEPRKLWRFSRLHRDFEGVVSRTCFNIRRIIPRRNSFLPVIEGAIQPRAQGGTRIDVTMHLHWSASAFMVAWSGGLVAIATAVLLHLHFGSGVGAPAPEARRQLPVFMGLMLCLGYGLCSVCFNLEAQRARDLLIKIVNGTARVRRG